MKTYTFFCDWRSFDRRLLDQPFVIVAQGNTLEEASRRAAEATLNRYPELAEIETPSTLWEGDEGAVQIAALYGDHTANIVDREIYDIFKAESLTGNTLN